MSRAREFSEMRSKLMGALSRIGLNNGHACPQTMSNIDPILHEYIVATDGESFFKKRRDAAKEALMSVTNNADLNDAMADVIKNDAPTSGVVLAVGGAYKCVADVKRPVEALNKVKLRRLLINDAKLSATAVDALFERATDVRKPAVTYKVVPND